MPFIAEMFTPEERNQLIRKITDAALGLNGEDVRPVNGVLIEDVRSREWSIGGIAITTGAVRAIGAEKS
jgi:4-oxalocrotonate tautomerase